MDKERGTFIALEGPDGSGKSTIAKMIGDYLEESGIEYILTREPGGTYIGEQIRGIILNKDHVEISRHTEALLYTAARSQHIDEKIVPALEEGKVVVCDRFVLSSLAYQGKGRNIGIDKVKQMNDFAIRDTYPDIILYFDIDPSITLKRKTEGNKADRLELEGTQFHREVYKGYMEVLERYPKNIILIDATKNIDEVYNQCIGIIREYI